MTLPVNGRNLTIAISVTLLHIGLIYVLYSGLMTRAVKQVVPAVILMQLIEPPEPKLAAQPVLAPPSSALVKKAVTLVAAMTSALPVPVVISDPTPAPNAPTGTTTPQSSIAAVAAPLATAPVATTAPASAAVQLPSSDADYLQNPSPPYPAISRRLNEQGKTTVRVLIGPDGQPKRAEIAKSSGFARLDDAALAAVMRWQYVPGKRGDVAEAMWFNVPINWVLR